MSIKMVAVKPFRYKRRDMVPGQQFSVKDRSEVYYHTKLKNAERVTNENPKVALDDARESVGLPALSKEGEDIAVLRKQYEDKFGKRPFYGWSVDALKQKIADV